MKVLNKPVPAQTSSTKQPADLAIDRKQMDRFMDHISKSRTHTPYMMTDLASITTQCKTFKNLFPDMAVFYAVKCFNNAEVIETVDRYVDGYDVASVAEIKKVLKLGVEPSRLTFSNPVKSEQSLAEAARLRLKRFAYQSANELIKIKKHIPDAEVYLRVKVPDHTSSIAFSSKFGCEPDDAERLLGLAKHLRLRPVGLTFHVGSQAKDPLAWDHALKYCRAIYNKVKKQGITLKVINIGGGFPVRYSNKDTSIDIVAKTINTAIKHHFGDLKGIEFIAEPGRFLVADSSAIVATVIGFEERGNKPWLFLDVGTFQAFIEVFEFGYFPYPVYSYKHLINQPETKKTSSYVLTGPSCDSYDTMALDVRLPSDMAIGDKLIIGKTGAYTLVYGSNFNGFKVPNRYFLREKE